MISCKTVKESVTTLNQDDLVNYFSSTLETDHLKNPDHAFYQKSIAVNDISTYRSFLWAAWKKANASRLALWPMVEEGKVRDSLVWQLPTGKKALFAVNKKGSRPLEGYPMYINLHGGGTMPEAKTVLGSIL